MNVKDLTLAVRWEVLKLDGEIRLQLFDEEGRHVDGKDAYWEGDFYCSYNKLTSLAGAPKSVGGYFYCNSNQLTSLAGAPKHVGGEFDCSYNKLNSLAGAPKQNDSQVKWDLFASFMSQGYVYVDRILKRLLNVKVMSNVIIYTVGTIGSDEVSFIAQSEHGFSHGVTVKEAINDLKFKITDRDVSEYKTWSLNTIASVDDFIVAYRKITGACEYGVREFVKNTVIYEPHTVQDVIYLTRGRFGNKVFEEFFNK